MIYKLSEMDKKLLSTINIEPLFCIQYYMLKYKYYHKHHILKSLIFAYFCPMKLNMIDHALIHIGKNLKFMLGNNQMIEF